MTTDFVTDSNYVYDKTNSGELSTLSMSWLNESELTSTVAPFGDEFPSTESVNNTSMDESQPFLSESQVTLSVFEAFIIIEIVMTAMELLISILAASKMERWRKNYRNQMLMQLSLVRFVKRTFALVAFLKDNQSIADSTPLSTTLIMAQIYFDFVIVILVFFFIKHMYDSLILVLVKISQHKLVKVLTCAWLLPLPVSAVGTALVATGQMEQWYVYLGICCVFRWPLMLIGTVVYISILYRVLKDKIRQFARSLTIITFMLCLVINLYLFFKDVIWLWCIHFFYTNLISYLLGFLLNFLILCLYIILISLNFQSNSKSSNSLPH